MDKNAFFSRRGPASNSIILLTQPHIMAPVLAVASDSVADACCAGIGQVYHTPYCHKHPPRFPELLQEMLGGSYTVRSFSRIGACVRHECTNAPPYRETEKYRNLLTSGAKEVLVLLGGNDAKESDWAGSDA